MVGVLPSLETQATLWQAGSHQPDCLAALTVAFDVLTHGDGAVRVVDAVGLARRLPEPPAWMRRRIVERRARSWADVVAGNVV
jgi:hypothetical protein